MASEDQLSLVGYCGLYCGLCTQRNRIPKQAKMLLQSLQEEGYDNWYEYVPRFKETYPTFRQFLQQLAESDCTCRTGGGPPECRMRNCAQKKSVKVCPKCKEYPCALIEDHATHYPTVIQDGKRMQKIGVEKWVKEQEERAERGVVYADIRYPWR